MIKTLHLKRKRADNSKYHQMLSYDLTDFTEHDLVQLQSCLKYFKEGSNGEFDFFISDILDFDGLVNSETPEGFFPAVDKARKEKEESE